MSQPVIKIKDLHKSFGVGATRKVVLKGVSLEVSAGQVVGFLGANGSGKTTTLAILAHLLTADSGLVSLLGRLPGDEEYHREVSFVSGDSEFFWMLTVQQTLRFYAKLNQVDRKEVMRTAELCRIDHRLTAAWESLSNGEKTRVRLARALLKRPKVLILDEPTVGLDPDVAIAVREILAELKRDGTAILLTSHYMQDIEALADYVYFLHEGRIVAEGEIATFRKSRNVVELTCRKLPSKELLRPNWSVTSHGTLELPAEDLIAALPLLEVVSIHSKEESLEDYFISVIKGRYD